MSNSAIMAEFIRDLKYMNKLLKSIRNHEKKIADLKGRV